MKRIPHGAPENGSATLLAPRPRSAPETAITPKKPPAGRRSAAAGMTVVDVEKLMVKPSVINVTIQGLTTLIVHNFGAKAVRQILDKQCGEAKVIREKKNPFNDFVESLYIINDKKVPKAKLTPGEAWPYVPETFGFPASAFKKAMVQACSFVDGIPKTWVRGLVHVHGNLLPLKYSKLVMRQDTVRVGPFGKKVADIRFRGEFHDWSTTLKISFNANAMSVPQIAMLLNNAGFAVGVGEWRPEKDGSAGTFSVGD